MISLRLDTMFTSTYHNWRWGKQGSIKVQIIRQRLRTGRLLAHKCKNSWEFKKVRKRNNARKYEAILLNCIMLWTSAALKNASQVTNCKKLVSHSLIHQALTRTMRSGWLIPVQWEETWQAMAVSWESKRLTGGGRHNLCAEMAVVMLWERSRAPACAPEKITYGRTICLACVIKRPH